MERDCNVATLKILFVISTHTLTWSVTGLTNEQLKAEIYFNSHAHVERDLHAITSLSKNIYFNSHAHVERDMLKWEIALLARISTHTLTWSVTC